MADRHVQLPARQPACICFSTCSRFTCLAERLERLFGPKRYLNLYFLSVIAAAITQLFFSAIAGGEPYPTVGASGGVFGLLLAYGMYFPTRMVMLLFPPIPMPAPVFVVITARWNFTWVLLELSRGLRISRIWVGCSVPGFLIRYWRGRFPFRNR